MATRSSGLSAIVAAMDRIERAMAALADLPESDQATVRAWVAATYPAPTALPLPAAAAQDGRQPIKDAPQA